MLKYTPKQDREYIEYARPIQQKVIQRLVSIIDRLEAKKVGLVKILKRLNAWGKTGVGLSKSIMDILKDTRTALSKHTPVSEPEKQWKILEQRIYPNTLNVYLAKQKGRYSFATMQLEIHEGLFDDKGNMCGHRIIYTKTQALQLHEHKELDLEFEVVGRGQEILQSAVLLNLKNQTNIILEQVGQEGYWLVKDKESNIKFIIEDLSPGNIDSQSINYDWSNDYNDWEYWEAGECQECGEIFSPVHGEMTHNELDSDSKCEGYINCEGPMMNYYYPCYGISGNEAIKIVHLPLCIVEVNGEIGLAFTGGGMDLSWEICEAFMCLGFLPPSYFCSLPHIGGRGKSEKDKKIIEACIETLQVLGRQYAHQADGLVLMLEGVK